MIAVVMQTLIVFSRGYMDRQKHQEVKNAVNRGESGSAQAYLENQRCAYSDAPHMFCPVPFSIISDLIEINKHDMHFKWERYAVSGSYLKAALPSLLCMPCMAQSLKGWPWRTLMFCCIFPIFTALQGSCAWRPIC